MNAATKIQASFRGHMARKQAEKSETGGPTESTDVKEKEADKMEPSKVEIKFNSIVIKESENKIVCRSPFSE